MSQGQKLGLALSGSGYRSAAFHLGTLKKLHELGILSRIDILSAVSGGSITAAFYCLNKYDFSSFEHSLYDILNTKDVLKKRRWTFSFSKALLFTWIFMVPAVYFLFTPYIWLSLLLFIFFIAVLVNFKSCIFPVNKRVERALDLYFYRKATLSGLTSTPELIIGSTNLETGGSFGFSRTRMEDLAYPNLTGEPVRHLPIEFDSHSFPIARAVAASCSGIFGNCPVRIDKKYFRKPWRDFRRARPRLVDGRFFDARGILPLIQAGRYNCSLVIVCDAGYKSPLDVPVGQNMNNATNLTRSQIAYLSPGHEIEDCIPDFIARLKKSLIPGELIRELHLHRDWVETPVKYEGELTDYLEDITGYVHINKPCRAEIDIARSVPFGLARLTKRQIDCLMKQAAALTELQVRLYCPGLL